jgi:hypothetical protein
MKDMQAQAPQTSASSSWFIHENCILSSKSLPTRKLSQKESSQKAIESSKMEGVTIDTNLSGLIPRKMENTNT